MRRKEVWFGGGSRITKLFLSCKDGPEQELNSIWEHSDGGPIREMNDSHIGLLALK